MDIETPPPRRGLKIALGALLGLLVLGLIAWGVWSLLNTKPGKQRKPPTVTLLPDKPPPPPPPPKEEKKPEPPKEDKKDVKIEQPKAVAPQPAANEPLKMEGAAGEGGGPFGAGTVGREYQGGAVTGGGGGAFAFYANLVQRHLQDELGRNRRLKVTDYRIVVRIWLARDGTVQKAELAASTGDKELDENLQAALLNAGALRELPPENLPQPLKIRITNRGSS